MSYDTVNSESAAIALLWDSQFFGFPVGKWSGSCWNGDAFSKANYPYHLTYIFSTQPITDSFPPGYHCSYHGKHVHFARATEDLAKPSKVKAYHGGGAMVQSMTELAWVAGQNSRFNVDPCISKSQFQQMYQIWMEKALIGKRADTVLCMQQDQQILGVVTGQAREDVGHIGLIAVHPAFQNQSRGQELLQAYISKAYHQSLKSVSVTTQGVNTQAQQAFVNAGFHLHSQQHVYHLWKKTTP